MAENIVQISKFLYIAVSLFALSGSLPLKCVWIELPGLSTISLESSNLHIYILVVTQCSNIAAFIYLLVHRCGHERHVSEVPVIYGGYAFGLVSLTILALSWRHSTYVLGEPHSVILFLCVLAAGAMSSLASVTYIPYIGRLSEVNLLQSYLHIDIQLNLNF